MSEQVLSNWRPQYMTATEAYPIASREEHIVPLLKRSFTCAVVVRHDALHMDASRISILQDAELADKYWYDESEERQRRSSGKVVHSNYVSEKDIKDEAISANIRLNDMDASLFTDKCNAIRDLFIRIYYQYTIDRPFEAMRGFTLFTPQGGQGRSPELHIDNTILSIHWAAAFATFRVYDGILSDETWNMLSMIERKKKTQQVQHEDFLKLVKLAKTLPMIENKIGDLMITKGQLGEDLSDPFVRQQVCVHVSSPSITQYGQVGFLMTPQMPKP
ncbi:MAG TPA: hypothetical protein DCM27_00965 [Rhodospirillaceae bacterium]|nr:hypothetical protein [Rhodospirillaceae bacterium]